MGLFIHRDLTYKEDDVNNGIEQLKATKNDIKDTSTNIINQIRRINSARGYSEYVGETIDTSSFTEYDNACNEVVDGLIEGINSMVTSINDYNNSSWIEQDFADIGMALTKFTEGIFSFCEQILDGVITIVGFIPVNIIDGINGNNDASTAFGEFIGKDYVGDWFYEQYETGIFKDMNKASDFTHTSTAASVFKMGGEIAPYIALSIVTGGAAGAGALALETAVAGVAGVGRKTQQELQSGKTFNEAAISGFGEGIKDAALTYGAGKLAKAMSASKALKSADNIDDAMRIADKGDDAMKLLDKGDEILALPEKATAVSSLDDVARVGADKIDDAVRIGADKVDDFTVVGEHVAKDGSKFVKVKYADGSVDLVNATTGQAANLGKNINPSKLKSVIGSSDEVASGATKVAAESTDNVAAGTTKVSQTASKTAAGSSDDLAAAAKKVESTKKTWQETKQAYKAAKKAPTASTAAGKAGQKNMVSSLKAKTAVAKSDYRQAEKAYSEASALSKAASAGKTGTVATKLAKAEGALEGTRLYRAVDNLVENGKLTSALVNPANSGKLVTAVRGAGVIGAVGERVASNWNASQVSANLKTTSGYPTLNAEAMDYQKYGADKIKGKDFTNGYKSTGDSDTGLTYTNPDGGSSTGGYTGGSTGGGGGSTGGGGGSSSGGGGGYSGDYTGGSVEPADAKLEQLKKDDDALKDATEPTTPIAPEEIETPTTPEMPGTTETPTAPSAPEVSPAAAVPEGSGYGTTQHTGGGYYGGEYVPDEGVNVDEASDILPLDETLLDDNTASIDEIIKGSKYTKIPTSSKPISATSSTGSGSSAVIPIAAGLSAAAAAGIGAKAYMDRKRNNDTDEDDDEFDTEEWSEDDSSLDINYDDSSDTETYLDDDDYSYQETEKYGARTSDELADMQ